MFDYSVISIDVENPVVDLKIPISANKIVVLSNADSTATVRVDDVSNDSIPVRATLELCAPCDDQISEIFVSFAGTAVAGDLLIIVAIFDGDLSVFA